MHYPFCHIAAGLIEEDIRWWTLCPANTSAVATVAVATGSGWVFFALEMSKTTIPYDAKNPGLGRGFLFPPNGGCGIGVVTLYK